MTVVRMSDLNTPNPVKGKVVDKEKKNRFIPKTKIKVQLEMQGNPIIELTSTLPMNVDNLDVGRTYNFRRYDVYYTKETIEPQKTSFSYDRGEEFSVVGKTGKERFYKAQ